MIEITKNILTFDWDNEQVIWNVDAGNKTSFECMEMIMDSIKEYKNKMNSPKASENQKCVDVDNEKQSEYGVTITSSRGKTFIANHILKHIENFHGIDASKDALFYAYLTATINQ